MAHERGERRAAEWRVKTKWRAVVKTVWRIFDADEAERVALRHAAGKHCSCDTCTGYYQRRARKDVKAQRQMRAFDEEGD